MNVFGCALLGGLLALPAAASERALLWSLQGQRNTIYLLGSVHALRSTDAAPGAAVQSAYADAERLLMEIDLDAPELADPSSLARSMQGAALLPAGQGLRSMLGTDYPELAATARRHGLDLEPFERYAPWFVALLLVQQSLVKQGLDPAHGLEQRIADLALRDRKPIEGLETPAEQFAIFAALTPRQQQAFLRDALADLDDPGQEATDLLDAWRRGDEAALAAALAEESAAAPELYGPLTVERNRSWVGDLEALLEEPDDYLVVVGALHLVGPDSVVDLLRKRGHRVQRH